MTRNNNVIPAKAGIYRWIPAFAGMTAWMSLCLGIPGHCSAGDPAPPRLFFSDAQLSLVIPEGWQVSPTFPIGSLMTRITPEKSKAYIDCQISDPIDPMHVTATVSTDTLKAFASQDAAARASNGQILSLSSATVVGQDTYQVLWEIRPPKGKAFTSQSVYFFFNNRYYVLTLRAHSDSFPTLAPDYQAWLASMRFLSRQNSATLDTPAHGGLWIHQTGGVRIGFGERWLIGVADDRQVGATIARDRAHLDFTVAMGPASERAREFGPEEIEQARQMVQKKGYTITSEIDEPFHGNPAFQLTYEGTRNGRFVRGQDTWVGGSRARWLINIEGDAPLWRQLTDDRQDVLSNIRFYD